MGNNGQRPPRDERPLKRQNKQAGGSSFLSDTVASRKHQLRQMAKDVGGGTLPSGQPACPGAHTACPEGQAAFSATVSPVNLLTESLKTQLSVKHFKHQEPHIGLSRKLPNVHKPKGCLK